jgi:hypothetical protein
VNIWVMSIPAHSVASGTREAQKAMKNIAAMRPLVATSMNSSVLVSSAMIVAMVSKEADPGYSQMAKEVAETT